MFTVKDIDATLEELLDLQLIIKSQMKRAEDIKNWCKEVGSFATDKYVCAVEKRTRVGLVGMDEAIRILGKETIELMKLSKASEFLLVHISKK